MKTFMQSIAIIMLINVSTTFCWPWVDQEKQRADEKERTEILGNNFKEEVIKRSLKQLNGEIDRKKNERKELFKSILLEKNIPSAKNDPLKDYDTMPIVMEKLKTDKEYRRLMKLQNTIRRYGPTIVLDKIEKKDEPSERTTKEQIKEKPYWGSGWGSGGVSAKESRKLEEFINQNIKKFNEKTDKQYGAGTAQLYWERIVENERLRDKERREDIKRKRDHDIENYGRPFLYNKGLENKNSAFYYSPLEQEQPSAWQRLVSSIKEWFTQKRDTAKSFTLPTFNRTVIKEQLSGISVPKAFTPSQKTLERAQKLTQPYNPDPATASKALKQQERFGIGYQ
jgi:hypothetical protein